MAKSIRANRKSGKLVSEVTDFSGGLNTADAVHEVADNEVVEGYNFDLNEVGAISKRTGFTQICASLGNGVIQGSFLFRRFNTVELLIVYEGTLYKYVTSDLNTFLGTGSWEPITIRRHSPQNTQAVLKTSGTVGGNLKPSISYDYAVAAKDASGVTMVSSVSRVTTGATAYPVDVTWDKVFGATGYDIYRAENNGVLAKVASVDNVATWTDTGAVVPAGAPPLSNTTVVSIPTTSKIHFINYNDRVFFTTGNGLCTYTGALDAALVTPYAPNSTELENVGINALSIPTDSIHKCSLIKLHWAGDRIFLAGDPDKPQNCYFTDSLTITFPALYFPPSYSFDITTANGSKVTAMENYRDAFVIFTTDSTHAVFGSQPDDTLPDFFTLRLIHTDIGAVAGRSVVPVANALIFVARTGIYALTSVVASATHMNVRYLSGKVEATFKKLQDVEKAAAIFHDQQYKVCFPSSGIVLRLYVNRQAWTLDYGYSVQGYFVKDNDLYMTSGIDGLVYKFGVKKVDGVEVETYSDNGQTIPFYFKTKSFNLSSTMNLKKLRESFIMARQYGTPSSAVMSVTIDYITTTHSLDFTESTALGTWDLGESRLGWVDVLTLPIKTKGKGHQVFYKFQNEIPDEPVTIYGIGTEFKIKAV